MLNGIYSSIRFQNMFCFDAAYANISADMMFMIDKLYSIFKLLSFSIAFRKSFIFEVNLESFLCESGKLSRSFQLSLRDGCWKLIILPRKSQNSQDGETLTIDLLVCVDFITIYNAFGFNKSFAQEKLVVINKMLVRLIRWCNQCSSRISLPHFILLEDLDNFYLQSNSELMRSQSLIEASRSFILYCDQDRNLKVF